MIIAIIDEYPIMRVGLGEVLSSQFDQAEILDAPNVTHFHELYPEKAPDIVLMGLKGGPKRDEADPFTTVKERYPNGRIIIFEEDLDYSIVSTYISRGASAYVTKKADLTELLYCFKCVSEGKKYLESEILIYLISTSNRKNSAERKISPREKQVAEYLISGMKVTFIAEKLNLRTATISTIKRSIFTKLDVNNLVDLARVMGKASN